MNIDIPFLNTVFTEAQVEWASGYCYNPNDGVLFLAEFFTIEDATNGVIDEQMRKTP